jgi:hypothetical protein
MRAGVKKARVVGLPSLSGEIDILAADVEGSVLWVIEVKDPYDAFSAAQLRNAVLDFHAGGTGHVDKVLRKAEDIGRDPAAVAKALGAAHPERTWAVRGLMVTRRPVAAAFVADPRVPFCSLPDVGTFLTGP